MLGFTSLLSICLRSTSLLLILFCLRVHYGWSRHELPPHLTAVSLRRSHPSTSCNPNHTLARAAVSCHPTSLSSVYVAPIHLHLVILTSHTLARAAMSCHSTSSFLDMSWRLMPSWPSCLTCICRAASSCASAVCSKDAMRVCS